MVSLILPRMPLQFHCKILSGGPVSSFVSRVWVGGGVDGGGVGGDGDGKADVDACCLFLQQTARYGLFLLPTVVLVKLAHFRWTQFLHLSPSQMTHAMLALTSLLQTGQYHTSGPGFGSMPAISSRIPSTDAGVGYST